MNKPSQQIAKELAMKCATSLHERYSDEWFKDLSYKSIPQHQMVVYDELHSGAASERERIANQILQSIPLVELLNLYKETTSRACRHPVEYNGYTCPTCIAILNLTTKFKQLEIIE